MGEIGNGVKASPDDTLTIAALGCAFNLAGTASPSHRSDEVGLDLPADVLQVAAFVLKIDLSHDASIVDQDVECRILPAHALVKRPNRLGIVDIALDRVQERVFPLDAIELGLIAPCNNDLVAELLEVGWQA